MIFGTRNQKITETVPKTEDQSKNDMPDLQTSEDKKEENIESSPSNGLENFDFDAEETPEWFNSDEDINENNEETSLTSETFDKEEDEL